MDMPGELVFEIERRAEAAGMPALLAAARSISERYRSPSGDRSLASEIEALAYAAARMPATLSVAYAVMSSAIPSGLFTGPVSLMDVGAGTGAVSWAAARAFDLSEVTCVEREPFMLELGRELMRGGPPELTRAKWRSGDIEGGLGGEAADLVVASYVLNELSAGERARAVGGMWSSAGRALILIEPGTPEGYQIILEARTALIERGAIICGPCPDDGPCPMEEGDWCHFKRRVQRSRLHKQLKGGDAPYEDENYSYIAALRPEYRHSKQPGARVLRHPTIGKGHVNLTLCTECGIIERTVSKREGDIYRAARKASAGDLL